MQTSRKVLYIGSRSRRLDEKSGLDALRYMRLVTLPNQKMVGMT